MPWADLIILVVLLGAIVFVSRLMNRQSKKNAPRGWDTNEWNKEELLNNPFFNPPDDI